MRLNSGTLERKSNRGSENGTTTLQQIIASCSGATITSLLVTPFDVVKVRLQKQMKVDHRGTQRHHHRRFVTPFDVVKVRLQAQARPLSPGRCFIYSNGLMDHLCTCSSPTTVSPDLCPWYSRPGKFSGTLDAFAKISRHEGIRALWSGLPPTLVMAIPATVCYYVIYDNLNVLLRRKFGPNSLCSMVAGATSRSLVVTLVSPLEMLRTKMQSEQIRYSEMSRVLSAAVKNQGWRALYSGWVATMLRDVPFSALYWGLYELTKRKLMLSFQRGEPTFSIAFVAGAFSGAISAYVTLPFDVIKTHKQVEIGEAQFLKNRQTSSSWAMLKRLYSQQGLNGIFSGAVPRIIKVAPACAIMIGTYEYFKAYFRKRNALLPSQI